MFHRTLQCPSLSRQVNRVATLGISPTDVNTLPTIQERSATGMFTGPVLLPQQLSLAAAEANMMRSARGSSGVAGVFNVSLTHAGLLLTLITNEQVRHNIAF